MGAGVLNLLLASTCLPVASFVVVAPFRLSQLVPPTTPTWRRKVHSPVDIQLASGPEGGKLKGAAVPRRPQGRALSMGEDNDPLDRR